MSSWFNMIILSLQNSAHYVQPVFDFVITDPQLRGGAERAPSCCHTSTPAPRIPCTESLWLLGLGGYCQALGPFAAISATLLSHMPSSVGTLPIFLLLCSLDTTEIYLGGQCIFFPLAWSPWETAIWMMACGRRLLPYLSVNVTECKYFFSFLYTAVYKLDIHLLTR